MQFSLRLNLKRDPSLVYTDIEWLILVLYADEISPPPHVFIWTTAPATYLIKFKSKSCEKSRIFCCRSRHHSWWRLNHVRHMRVFSIPLTRESSSNYEKPSSVLRKCPALTAHSHPNNICQSRQLSVKKLCKKSLVSFNTFLAVITKVARSN